MSTIADAASPIENVLTRKDLAIGTGIAVVMGATFATVSSGRSLLVTFIPGLLIAWLIFAWMYGKRIVLPSAPAFVPLFFATLALQFLHFAEESVTDFRTFFPVHYGGTPYSNTLFVCFNMFSYTVFSLACVMVFYKRVRFLLMPVLFFITYGAIGNAISHSFWVLDAHAYRPGFFTALPYWIAGPYLLYRLIGQWRPSAVAVFAFAAILIPLIFVFAVP